jgi:uncharacterized protein (UPF0212 family)
MNNEPRKYNLTSANEKTRLYEELLGYMKVSLGAKCPYCHKQIHEGTDFEGRQYAIEALEFLIAVGW